MSRRVKKWLAWMGMLLTVVLFTASDVYANELEKDGRGQADEPVTATGWVRKGIRTGLWIVGPILMMLWLVWHFFVQAFYPGMPL